MLLMFLQKQSAAIEHEDSEKLSKIRHETRHVIFFSVATHSGFLFDRLVNVTKTSALVPKC